MTTQQQQGLKVYEIKSKAIDKPKLIERLAKTDLIGAMSMYVEDGGENTLHAHTGSDGFYIVFEGEATFYGEGDQIIAKVGPGEMVLVPRGTKYWFGKSSTEQMVMLRVWAEVPNVKDERIRY